MSFGPPAERHVDTRTRLAVDFAHAAFHDAYAIPESTWDELRAHFSERELMELIFVTGFYTGSQLMTFLLDTDVEQPR